MLNETTDQSKRCAVSTATPLVLRQQTPAWLRFVAPHFIRSTTQLSSNEIGAHTI